MSPKQSKEARNALKNKAVSGFLCLVRYLADL